MTNFSPTDGFVFDTHTEIQKEFLRKIKEVSTENALLWLSGIKNDRELSYPARLRFEWENDGKECLFELSTSKNFCDGAKFVTRKGFFEAENLKVGTKYFWRINGKEPHFFTRQITIFAL